MKQSPELLKALKDHISPTLPTSSDIQAKIASQKGTLLRHPTLLDALMDHILSSYFLFCYLPFLSPPQFTSSLWKFFRLCIHVKLSVATPLAKLIFVLEKYCAIWTYFHSPQLQSEWLSLFQHKKISGIRSLYSLYFF